MNEIVFDIETVGNIQDFSTMKITVVSIYEYSLDRYQSFIESELVKLWPILERADRIIGYNSEHFDLPILNNYYLGDLKKIPHLDLLKKIQNSLGFRLKLKDVASATLNNLTKSADGLTAMRWWQEGKVEEVKRYCEQDVRVTKELYEYGLNNGELFYRALTGERLSVRVDFTAPAKVAAGSQINLSLPF